MTLYTNLLPCVYPTTNIPYIVDHKCLIYCSIFLVFPFENDAGQTQTMSFYPTLNENWEMFSAVFGELMRSLTVIHIVTQIYIYIYIYWYRENWAHKSGVPIVIERWNRLWWEHENIQFEKLLRATVYRTHVKYMVSNNINHYINVICK